MHHSNSSDISPEGSRDLLLREAKRLHRAAQSDSPAESLPVLRRLLAAEAIPGPTLPAAFRARTQVQRKHVLRALTLEAGYPSWEALVCLGEYIMPTHSVAVRASPAKREPDEWPSQHSLSLRC